MKKVMLLSLCALSMGSILAETAMPFQKDATGNASFEEFLKNKQAKIENLKSTYKNFASKVNTVVEDSEVVAARKELYATSKKLFSLVQQKMALTEEEKAQLIGLFEVFKKTGKGDLNEEEQEIIDVLRLTLVELVCPEQLEAMVEKEIAFFQES